MKKRMLCVLLICAMLVSMAACGTGMPDGFPEELSLDTLYPILNEGRATLISSTAEGQSGETAAKLFDGNLSTKLCTDVEDYVITWKMNRAYAVGGYIITTANDSAENGRLPRGWTFEVSNDGTNWLIVSNIINSRLERVNFTDYFYAISQPGDYQYFRFTLTDAGSTRRHMTQMAEITLYGPERAEYEEEKKDFSDNKHATAGVELLKTLIKDYYDDEANKVLLQTNQESVADLRGVAAFLEALAEGYRLCPEDPLIYNTYVDVLNFVLTTYREEKNIETPNGNKDVVYYKTNLRGSSGNGGFGGGFGGNNGGNNGGGWREESQSQNSVYRYDYNALICIQYLNAYNLLGDSVYLRRAEDLLDYLWTGWDESRQNGGIYLDENFENKSASSNATVATAFLSAYEITGFADYLTKGKQIYDWCATTLKQNDLYCDSIDRKGSLNTGKNAGNQGVMLAASCLLYQTTEEARYLQEARMLYQATVDLMFGQNDNYGSLNGTAIDNACSIGWLARGFILFQGISKDNTTTGTKYLSRRLQMNLRSKNETGYYDPFFQTGQGQNQSTEEVIHPSGVASAYLLDALYAIN